MKRRRCNLCSIGVPEANGYAATGRPCYRCSYCGGVWTNGNAGYPWDARGPLAGSADAVALAAGVRQ